MSFPKLLHLSNCGFRHLSPPNLLCNKHHLVNTLCNAIMSGQVKTVEFDKLADNALLGQLSVHVNQLSGNLCFHWGGKVKLPINAWFSPVCIAMLHLEKMDQSVIRWKNKSNIFTSPTIGSPSMPYTPRSSCTPVASRLNSAIHLLTVRTLKVDVFINLYKCVL